MNKIDTKFKAGTPVPSKIISIVGLVISIPHELSHYLVGRLLGVDIQFGLYRTKYKAAGVPTWKRVLISSAPTFLGLAIAAAFIIYLLSGDFTKPRAFVTLYGVTYAALMLATCLGDWQSIRRTISG